MKPYSQDGHDLPPVPKVAAPHLCAGPGCYFCDWSNPPLELPGLPEAEGNPRGACAATPEGAAS